MRPRLRIRSRPDTPHDEPHAGRSPALRSLRPSVATFKPLRPSLKQAKRDKVAVGAVLVPKEGGAQGRGAGHGALAPRPDPPPSFRITSHPSGQASRMVPTPTVLAEPVVVKAGGEPKIVKAERLQLTLAARLKAAKRAAGDSDTDDEGGEGGEGGALNGTRHGLRGSRNIQRSRAALTLPAYVLIGPAADKH